MISELDRQLWNYWRRRFQGKHKGAPRIAVVGNCQSFGVAYGMKLQAPQAQVDRYTIVRKGLGDLNQLVRVLRNYDHVFSIEFGPGFLRGGASHVDLRARLPQVRTIPSLVFTGYHPDVVYALDPTRGGHPIEGPGGHYHSAIALYAFLRGFSLEQTQALFAGNVFEALGYYDVWGPAGAELIALGKASGVDLSADFARWSRGAPFMYSINHPKPFVLYDLARALLRNAGLPTAEAPADFYAVDDVVRGVVYPVYPEIAERYGQKGAYLFKKSNYDIDNAVGEFLDLPGFLQASFADYARRDRAQLVTPRTDAWFASAETGRLFDYLAADNLARFYARR